MPQLVPPLRFGCAESGVYRGAYPLESNIEFLQGLRLKTIVTITPEPLMPLRGLEHVNFIHIQSAGQKEESKKKRGVPITQKTVEDVLSIIGDPSQRPVYVHCLNGSQVTCLVIACLRRRCHWTLVSVLSEFSRYSVHDRSDNVFIETFPTACPTGYL